MTTNSVKTVQTEKQSPNNDLAPQRRKGQETAEGWWNGMAKGRRPAEKTGGSSGGGRTTGRRTTNRVQAGNYGGKSQWGALSRDVMVGLQAKARTALYGGVNGGRSQGVTGTHATMGTTGGDGGDGGGAQSTDREPRRWHIHRGGLRQTCKCFECRSVRKSC